MDLRSILSTISLYQMMEVLPGLLNFCLPLKVCASPYSVIPSKTQLTYQKPSLKLVSNGLIASRSMPAPGFLVAAVMLLQPPTSTMVCVFGDGCTALAARAHEARRAFCIVADKDGGRTQTGSSTL